jgi:RHS repeat-associated protein
VQRSGAYEVTGSKIRKYYSFAGQTFAVCEQDTSVSTNWTLSYFLTDHLGSVVAVTNASGTLTSQQRYLPFGGERTNIGTISQTDFGYTAQRKLASGMGELMDYKARFYSPCIMQFMQPDSLIPDPSNTQAWNRYSHHHISASCKKVPKKQRNLPNNLGHFTCKISDRFNTVTYFFAL